MGFNDELGSKSSERSWLVLWDCPIDTPNGGKWNPRQTPGVEVALRASRKRKADSQRANQKKTSFVAMVKDSTLSMSVEKAVIPPNKLSDHIITTGFVFVKEYACWFQNQLTCARPHARRQRHRPRCDGASLERVANSPNRKCGDSGRLPAQYRTHQAPWLAGNPHHFNRNCAARFTFGSVTLVMAY